MKNSQEMKVKGKTLKGLKNSCTGLSNSSNNALKVKAYKKLSFVEELVKFFKIKGDVWVSQEDILYCMCDLGFSRSYAYIKVKKYSQGVVKRHFGNDKPDILEPLLLEKSRIEFDGVQGVVYKLNEEWAKFTAQEIQGAFNGN